MRLGKRLKQLFCRHDYKPWANIHGDMINNTGCRTVLLCPKCGQRKFKKDYIKAPLNYNVIVEYFMISSIAGSCSDKLEESLIERMFVDEKQYIDLYCKEDENEQ